MADFSTLIATLQATIKTNYNQEITGQILQGDLLAMVNTINQLKQDTLEGYGFYGAPLADGASVNVTQNTFFLVGPGTYTINGEANTIAGAGVSVLAYDSVNDEVRVYSLFSYDTTPTAASKNAITSGAVHTALAAKQDKDTDAVAGNVAVMNASGDSEDGGVPLSDLATKAEVAVVAGEAGLAEAVIDTDNAGTEQEFTFRKSGGDGGAYYRKIKGKTLAWNQLVGADTTEVTIPSGRKYFAVINGTASVATSDGTALAVTGGQDMVVDLTLAGIADEISTAADFLALYPNPLPYNPGTLISNDAEAVETTGANQWDEECTFSSTTIKSANFIPCIPLQNYYLKAPNNNFTFYFYNKEKEEISITGSINYNSVFTIPEGAYYMKFADGGYGTTYNHNICINLSNPAINGQYFPYWKRTLQLGITTHKDTDGNVPFADGMKGAGTASDWADKVGGEKRVKRINLGDLAWGKDGGYLCATMPSDYKKVSYTTINFITPLAKSHYFDASIEDDFAISEGRIYVGNPNDRSINDFVASIANTPIDYELATPVPFTWAEPLNLGVKVDENGTERAVAPEGATAPSAPFVADTTYTMSVARMVEKLQNL